MKEKLKKNSHSRKEMFLSQLIQEKCNMYVTQRRSSIKSRHIKQKPIELDGGSLVKLILERFSIKCNQFTKIVMLLKHFSTKTTIISGLNVSRNMNKEKLLLQMLSQIDKRLGW